MHPMTSYTPFTLILYSVLHILQIFKILLQICLENRLMGLLETHTTYRAYLITNCYALICKLAEGCDTFSSTVASTNGSTVGQCYLMSHLDAILMSIILPETLSLGSETRDLDCHLCKALQRIESINLATEGDRVKNSGQSKLHYPSIVTPCVL